MSETCSPRKILALRAEGVPIVDVRSPGEFSRAHLLGAHSLPLFSDEERAAVGTLYAQEGRDAAVKAMRYMLNLIHMDAEIVIGEGEIDHAPMLYIGEKVGSGMGELVSIAPEEVCGARRLHGSFLLPGYRCIVWREATAPITRR